MKKCNFGGHWARADWCRHSLLCKKACPHSLNMNLWSLLVISIWLMYQNKPICADLTPEVRGLFWGGAGGGGGCSVSANGWFLFPPRTNGNGATGFFFFFSWMNQRKTKERTLQNKFHGKKFLFINMRYFPNWWNIISICSWCQQVMRRSGKKKKEWMQLK